MPDEPAVSPLPSGIRSRHLALHDLNLHILESSPEINPRPGSSKPHLIILLHGFPELSFSWRKVMPPLSQAGYYVVAPDHRGIGRTTSVNSPAGQISFDDDLTPFCMLSLVKDVVSIVYALDYDHVTALVGHDFGSLLAGYCALIRPDIFRSVVMMSAPFPGSPTLRIKSSPSHLSLGEMAARLQDQLATLIPPRKHYTMYYSTRDANAHLLRPPQGLRTFFREYYHAKSADWVANSPHPLPSASASALAELPHYYIMLRDQTMPEAVMNVRHLHEGVPAWLTDEELSVYVTEYSRTGFQGGLNWYRCATDAKWSSELEVFSGKRIAVPAMFISGEKDWGTYQSPGVAESMKERVCERMEDEDFVLIEGAGHWVQQEKSDAVVENLLRFLGKVEDSFMKGDQTNPPI
ncbi:hypothetical protein D9758_002966 [Tetrapyrgos nigripes]|uniref:AB hydrolase-1 domain-containing protein n=1 Tax=Tetrapyrgos nigripes TaxID=182062 RepID=A0A8H5GQC2_9AGAR|nr:hypothetical protein D9758_002966 [Tetrapyrgos nigripes]